MLHIKNSLYFIINIIHSENCKSMAFLRIQSDVLYSIHYHHIHLPVYTSCCLHRFLSFPTTKWTWNAKKVLKNITITLEFLFSCSLFFSPSFSLRILNSYLEVWENRGLWCDPSAPELPLSALAGCQGQENAEVSRPYLTCLDRHIWADRPHPQWIVHLQWNVHLHRFQDAPRRAMLDPAAGCPALYITWASSPPSLFPFRDIVPTRSTQISAAHKNKNIDVPSQDVSFSNV